MLFLHLNVFDSNFDVNLLTQSEQINLFRLTQPFSTLGVFLFPPLVVRFFYNDKLNFKFSEFKISFSTAFSASILIIMVKPVVAWLAYFNNNIDFSSFGDTGVALLEASKQIADKIAMVAKSNSQEELMLNIFIIALLPAIAEEFFFRGFIQNFLSKLIPNYHISVWLTAIAFGMIHFNIVAIIPLIFLGAILGYIYHYSQNIWVSILAHFINNASLLWFVYKYSLDMQNTNIDSLSIQSIIFSLMMTFGLLFFLQSVWSYRKASRA